MRANIYPAGAIQEELVPVACVIVYPDRRCCYSCFIVAGGNKFAIKALLCNTQYFTSFTVTCNSTTHRKRTVYFHCNNDCTNKLQSPYPILFCAIIFAHCKFSYISTKCLVVVNRFFNRMTRYKRQWFHFRYDRDLYLPFVCSCEQDKEFCDSMNSKNFSE